MQENLIGLLRSDGIELQKVGIKEWEEQKKEIYRIKDSERLIFVVELRKISEEVIEDYVNRLMEWITYEQPAMRGDMVDEYGHITMRMILWDMYVIFVSHISKPDKRLQDEEIYPIQRNSHFMKRYIVQGTSDNEIARKISFIVKLERTIDDFINKLDFENNEKKYCRQMSYTEEGEAFNFDLKGETYQEIISVLEKINGADFGEDTNENT